MYGYLKNIQPGPQPNKDIQMILKFKSSSVILQPELQLIAIKRSGYILQPIYQKTGCCIADFFLLFWNKKSSGNISSTAFQS